MNTNRPSFHSAAMGPIAAVTSLPHSPATPVEQNGLSAAIAPDAVRILLSLDVPVVALAQIEADWELVAKTQDVAPDLVPELVDLALQRLRQHAIQVNGVAVAERVPSPLAAWMRRAA